MPYRNTVFLKDTFYHLFNRGNRKQNIFFTDRDYERFLDKLKDYKNEFKVDIVAYALLPNHFHFLASSRLDEGIPKLMKSLFSSQSHYVSVKYSLPGHLFQGPFKAKIILEEASFLQVFRYICLQPIKEKILESGFIRKGEDRLLGEIRGLISSLRSFRWGSYREYLEPTTGALSFQEPALNLFKNIGDLRRFVEAKVTRDDIFRLDSFDTFASPSKPPPEDPGSVFRHDN